MIFIGIDDTDTLDTPGTNQLARKLVAQLAGRYRCRRIIRHQLLFDPRVPYTSHNSSASMLLEPIASHDLPGLIEELRSGMRDWFVPGSDPGLCVTEHVSPEIVAHGRRCQQALVSQQDARDLASVCKVHLEGLGGTQDGVIGALAAVGLAATGEDGRVVQVGHWADDLAGPQDVRRIREREVEVREVESGAVVAEGVVDLVKKLRPNCRAGGVVLFVERVAAELAVGNPVVWRAVRLP